MQRLGTGEVKQSEKESLCFNHQAARAAQLVTLGAGKDAGSRASHVSLVGMGLVSAFWESNLRVSIRIKICISFDPAVPFYGSIL